jgi:hypothetical protein
MSVCFRLAALHEFVPSMAQNPISLIKLRGATKRIKKISELSIPGCKKLLSYHHSMDRPEGFFTLDSGLAE